MVNSIDFLSNFVAVHLINTAQEQPLYAGYQAAKLRNSNPRNAPRCVSEHGIEKKVSTEGGG